MRYPGPEINDGCFSFHFELFISLFSVVSDIYTDSDFFSFFFLAHQMHHTTGTDTLYRTSASSGHNFFPIFSWTWTHNSEVDEENMNFDQFYCIYFSTVKKNCKCSFLAFFAKCSNRTLITKTSPRWRKYELRSILLHFRWTVQAKIPIKLTSEPVKFL